MKNLAIFICLLICMMLSSCDSCQKKGNDNFYVESAYYFAKDGSYQEFIDGNILKLDNIYQQSIRINVEFKYLETKKNVNELSKVVSNIDTVSYTIYVNGKKEFTTITDDSPTEKVEFKKVADQDDTYMISRTNALKIPTSKIGKYRVVLYANYFIGKERIASEIEFKFEVK